MMYFWKTMKTISVEVLGDTTIEDHETFSVMISDAVNATIASGAATGTILNDDTALFISGPADAIEGNSGTTPLVFTIALEKESALPVTVSYSTVNGTATSPQVRHPRSSTPHPSAAPASVGVIRCPIRRARAVPRRSRVP